MAVRYSLERPENGLYARNAAFLRSLGVPVPRVLADLPHAQLTIMEDAGDVALLDRVMSAPPSMRIRLYRDVLDAVWPMYTEGGGRASTERLPLAPSFSAEVYAWERDLFFSHFLRGRLSFSRAQFRASAREIDSVATRLLDEPLVLVHRDLQSTNVLLQRGKPVILDFQGMRLGPAVYDFASLLCDPYVSLALDTQLQLLAYCAEKSGRHFGEFANAFWFAAVERLIQAIGAYARLGAIRETRAFSQYIPPAFRMLSRALDRIGGLPHLSSLAVSASDVAI
jgi:aminoglycoside/choline kinase family phosphotransferase